jgi:hypothetical protein
MLGHRDPMDAYRAYVLYGSDFQDWKHPYEMMLDPYLSFQSAQSLPEAAYGGAMLGVLGRPGSRMGLAVGGAIYGSVASIAGPSLSNKEAEREKTEAYFDKLRYAKYRALEDIARQKGKYDIVSKMQNMEASTMTGLQYGGDVYQFYMNAYKALPKKDKGYLLALASDPSTNINELPTYMRGPVQQLRMSGYGSSPGAGQRVVDKSVADDLTSQGMPSPSWAGWSPDINVENIKAVTVAGEGGNLHDYGSTDASVSAMISNMPQLQPIEVYNPDLYSVGRSRYNIQSALGSVGIRGSASVVPVPGRGGLNINVDRDRSDDRRTWMNRGRW